MFYGKNEDDIYNEETDRYMLKCYPSEYYIDSCWR